MGENLEKDLKNTVGDYVHTGTKFFISNVFPCGGILSEIFDFLVSTPLEKRKEEWLIELNNGVQRLQETVEDFKLENLIENELFQTIVLDATHTALKTHQQLKRQALCNACINSAKGINISEDKQLIFIKIIDQLTDMDIKLLLFLYNPDSFLPELDEGNEEIRYGNRAFNEITNIYPDLEGEESLLVSRMHHLIGLGIMKDSSKQIDNRSLGDIYDLMTDLGREFMEYISKEEN